MKENKAKELSYEGRVKEEKLQLDSKIKRLQNFIEGDSSSYKFCSGYEKQDLRSQLSVMESYSQILRRRINRFNE